jgi:hypothetical protein
MGILTGRDEAIRVVALAEYAFFGNLTDYAKGLYLKGINKTMFIDIYECTHRYVNAIITTNRYIYT